MPAKANGSRNTRCDAATAADALAGDAAGEQHSKVANFADAAKAVDPDAGAGAAAAAWREDPSVRHRHGKAHEASKRKQSEVGRVGVLFSALMNG
jgi:hypothetical protein